MNIQYQFYYKKLKLINFLFMLTKLFKIIKNYKLY